jgi:cobalt-zinc-cadmium efflux system membrane fusion protein
MSSPTSTDPGPTEPIEAPETEGAESGRAARVVRFVRDRKLLVAGISVGLVAVVLLGAYLARGDRAADDHGHAHDAEAGDGTPTVTFLMEQQWLVEMKFETVEATQVARQVTTTGRVVPAANLHAVVAPPVGGILTGQLPRIGQAVRQGQTIAVVRQTATSGEAAQVQAAVAQAESQNAQIAIENARLESELRSAAAEVSGAESRLRMAERDLERARQLHEKGVIAAQAYQQAETARDEAKSAHAAAVARRDALAGAKRVAPVSVGKVSANAAHALQAPLSGVVTKVHKSLGEQVSPGDPVLEVASLDEVWIEAPVFERDLARIGGPVRAFFSTIAYPNEEFPGELVDRGAVVDERTRAATVVFRVPNAGRPFRIGMQANVRIDAGETVEAVLVSKEAVLDHEGKKIVYVRVAGEEFERREVTLGDEHGGKVAVLSGLEAGERVVTQGAYQLKLHELKPTGGGHTHEH